MQPAVYGIFLYAPDPSYDVHDILIQNVAIKHTPNVDSGTASDGIVPGFYTYNITVRQSRTHDIGLGAPAGPEVL